MNGWCNCIVRVDLTTNTITKTPLSQDVARQFLGGRGFNSRVLFDEISSGIDPLGPQNIICLAPGLLSGTPLGLTSRVEVSTLSPYSGILGDGNAGGKFAAFLKQAGYDQIIITGQASSPAYLFIDHKQVELKDATDLWGKTTWETTDILIERHGRDISVACIGQAGENLVRFATTIIDKYASAARGSGAVLGAKKLKAIVVRGKNKVKLADPNTFKTLIKEDFRFLTTNKFQTKVASVYGSLFGVLHWHPGFKNYQKYLTAREIPSQLRPGAWKKYEIGRHGCYGCPIRCKNIFRIPEGQRAGEVGAALEYECIFCLGVNCGLEDPIAIMEMENLCDAYGMDVIALGNTIAFAKDLFNRGIITLQDTGGFSLTWTNKESQIELIHLTAFRKDFGNYIAEGLYSLAKIFGKESLPYCFHVKGLSRGPHPAGLFSLAHATSTRGADHLRGRSWAYWENDAFIFSKLVKTGILSAEAKNNLIKMLSLAEYVCTLADAIGRCKGAINTWSCALPLVWKAPIFKGLAKLLQAATGLPFTEDELIEIAERIYTIEKAFNVRCGITVKHEDIPLHPEHFSKEQMSKEKQKHGELLRQYYSQHGQDPETAIPQKAYLEKLGLSYVAERLEKEGPYPEWDGPPLWPLNKYLNFRS